MRPFKNYFKFFQKALQLCGPRVPMLFMLTVPIGLALGLAEIAFGYTLLYFFGSYGLTVPSSLPSWYPSVLSPVVSLVCIGGVRSLLSFLSLASSHMSFELFNVEMRMKTTQTLTEGSQPRYSVADASHALSSLIQRSGTFFSSITQMLVVLFTLMVAVISLGRLSLALSLIATLAVAFFGLPLMMTKKLYHPFSVRVYAAVSEFSKRLLKDLRNLDFLNIVGQVTSERKALIRINESIFKNYSHYTFWSDLSTSWPQFAGICVTIVIVISNSQYAWVESTVLVPFIYILMRVSTNISTFIAALGTAQFSHPFVLNLINFFDQDAQVLRASSICLPGQTMRAFKEKLKSVEACEISIGRETVLVEDLSFSAQESDFVWFTGESGRGKTTLLMTLIGQIAPKKGAVLWNGTDLSEFDLCELQKRLAYSGPDPFLLDMTIRENLFFGNEHLQLKDEDLWSALRLTACDFVDQLPRKLDFRLSEGGDGISAGQKQRLSLARALMRKPEVLLLDEATANIDAEIESVVLTNIKKELSKSLILTVSHRESMAKFATQRIAL